MKPQTFTVFHHHNRVGAGSLSEVRSLARSLLQAGATSVLAFEDQSGNQVDLDGRDSELVAARPEEAVEASAPSKRVGRPRLGVVAREVTLLPRQWEWLAQQPGGASASLRRLVEQARREGGAADRMRASREAIYRFLTAIAGDCEGYEESLRALFAGDYKHFVAVSQMFPTDVREHVWRMAPAAFGFERAALNDVVPFTKRAAVERALSAAFGDAEIERATPVLIGASGAGLLQLELPRGKYVLRVEGAADGFRDPKRQYACMEIAVAAGVAPALLYADAGDGVAVTALVDTRPHASLPRPEFLQKLGALLRRLHEAPLFPPLVEYLDGLERLVEGCKATGILPKAALEGFWERYAQLTATYRSLEREGVSSHNDLNPGNLLFDGERLWLVDWEAAFAADRYVDLAAVANFFTQDEAELELILSAYFGAALSQRHRDRLLLMRPINRVFYAAVMLNYVAAAMPETRLTEKDLVTPAWVEARAELKDVARHEVKARLACVLLQEARAEMESEQLHEAMARLRQL